MTGGWGHGSCSIRSAAVEVGAVARAGVGAAEVKVVVAGIVAVEVGVEVRWGTIVIVDR